VSILQFVSYSGGDNRLSPIPNHELDRDDLIDIGD